MADRKPDDLIVTLTYAELEALVTRAAERGATRVANQLRDERLTTKEVAAAFGFAESTVKAAVTRGDLVPVDRATGGGRGRTHRFLRSEVERWRREKGAA